MTRFERLIQRFPGSTPVKAFLVSSLLIAGLGYPVFSKSPKNSRQGHDYLSSERPEAIQASQERWRKENRIKRNLVLERSNNNKVEAEVGVVAAATKEQDQQQK
jgi:hypothetical protein